MANIFQEEGITPATAAARAQPALAPSGGVNIFKAEGITPTGSPAATPNTTAPKVRVGPGFVKLLRDSGLPASDQIRLMQTGITPGNAMEWGAAAIQQVEKQRGGRPIPTSEQLALEDTFKHLAGRTDTSNQDFYQQTRRSEQQNRESTVLGRLHNAGLNAVSDIGSPAYSLLKLVAPQTGNELEKSYNDFLNPNTQSLSGHAGQIAGELIKLPAYLETGAIGMASLFGAQAAGEERGRVQQLRAHGEDISNTAEWASALGVAVPNAAIGVITGGLFKGAAKAVEAVGGDTLKAMAEGNKTAIRQGVTAMLKHAGIAVTQGSQMALLTLVTNKIKQGVDPQQALTSGVAQAFVTGALMTPFGEAAARAKIARNAEKIGAKPAASKPNPNPEPVMPEGETPPQKLLEAGEAPEDAIARINNEAAQRRAAVEAQPSSGRTAVTDSQGRVMSEAQSEALENAGAKFAQKLAQPVGQKALPLPTETPRFFADENGQVVDLRNPNTERRQMPQGRQQVEDLENAGQHEQAQAKIAELHDRLYTDPTTGAGTIHMLHDEGDRVAERAQKRDAAQPVAYLDVRNLHTGNEVLGHKGMDDKMREWVKIIQKHAGPNAVVMRHGGDEFSVLWPKGESQRAAKQKIAAATKEIGNQELTNGVTTGMDAAVDRIKPGEGYEPGLHRASEEVQTAKVAGKSSRGEPTTREGAKAAAQHPQRMSTSRITEFMGRISPDLADVPADQRADFFKGTIRDLGLSDTTSWVKRRVPRSLFTDQATDQGLVKEYQGRKGEGPPIVAALDENGNRVVIDGKHRLAAGEGDVDVYVPRHQAQRFPEQVEPLELKAPPEHEQARRLALRQIETERRAKVREENARQASIDAQKAAAEYHRQSHLPPVKVTKLKAIPRRKARQMATAYASAKHDPNDPQVKASYEAFKQETLKQFKRLVQDGYTFTLAPTMDVAAKYPDVAALVQDLGANKHLLVNEDQGAMPADHPLQENVPDMPGWTYNHLFRAVHDILGHALQSNGFDLLGEENAWRSHSTLYSDLARGALTTETRGQTSTVGYGPDGIGNRKAIAAGDIGQVVFPEQKATLLPKEYWTDTGMEPVSGGDFDENDLTSLMGAVAPDIQNVAHQNILHRALSRTAVPTGTVIRRWMPRLYGVLKQMEQSYRSNRQHADYFVHKAETLAKEELSKDQIKDALYADQTGDPTERQRILQEAGASDALVDAWDMMHQLHNLWYSRGKDAGMKLGEVENHAPRQVKPGMYDEWADQLAGSERDELDKLLAQEAQRLGRPLTLDEKTKVGNQFAAGTRYSKPGNTSTRFTGRRSVNELSRADWEKYYDTGFKPWYNYLDRMIYNVHKSELFGKGADEETLADSIGRVLVDGQYGADKLSRYQKNRVRSALQSVFTGGEMSAPALSQFLRDFGYVGVLLDPTSAAIQITDNVLTAVREGSLVTLKSIPQSMREKVLTTKNLGLEHLSAEYGNNGKFSKTLHRGFQAVGFQKMDAGALTVSMVAARNKAAELVKNPKSKQTQQWAGEWRQILGDDTFTDLVRDLKSGTPSDAVKLYTYMRASENRPIDKLDMPEYYNKHPNLRLLYQLKSFALLQLNLVRRRGVNQIAEGLKAGDPVATGKGVALLARTMVMLAGANAGADWLRDWLLGRNPNMEEALLNGFLSLGVGSKYLMTDVLNEGPGTAVMDFVAPPVVSMVDQMYRDATTGTYKSLRYLPFGKLIYSVTPEAQADSAKYAKRDAKARAVAAWADGDTGAARTYLTAYNRGMTGTKNRQSRLKWHDIVTAGRAKRKETS